MFLGPQNEAGDGPGDLQRNAVEMVLGLGVGWGGGACSSEYL